MSYLLGKNHLKCRIAAVLGSIEQAGKSTMIGASVTKPHTTYIVIYIYYISVVRIPYVLKYCNSRTLCTDKSKIPIWQVSVCRAESQ